MAGSFQAPPHIFSIAVVDVFLLLLLCPRRQQLIAATLSLPMLSH
jgi:hypothetical protein